MTKHAETWDVTVKMSCKAFRIMDYIVRIVQLNTIS